MQRRKEELVFVDMLRADIIALKSINRRGRYFYASSSGQTFRISRHFCSLIRAGIQFMGVVPDENHPTALTDRGGGFHCLLGGGNSGIGVSINFMIS